MEGKSLLHNPAPLHCTASPPRQLQIRPAYIPPRFHHEEIVMPGSANVHAAITIRLQRKFRLRPFSSFERSVFNKPSKANEEAFLSAVQAIAGISTNLLNSLETNAPPRNRDEEAARLKALSAKRFGSPESIA
jgi:hypothetical protein